MNRPSLNGRATITGGTAGALYSSLCSVAHALLLSKPKSAEKSAGKDDPGRYGWATAVFDSHDEE